MFAHTHHNNGNTTQHSTADHLKMIMEEDIEIFLDFLESQDDEDSSCGILNAPPAKHKADATEEEQQQQQKRINSPSNGPVLTEEQSRPVDAVVGRRRSAFVTGDAGTGKSVVLRAIVEGLEAQMLNVAKAASTGIAAVAIGGTTLHYLLRMGACDAPMEELVNQARERRTNNPSKVMWRGLDVLVLDEISMFDAEFFDKAERIIAAYRGREELPFGGLQVVFFGDFFQLPPVLKANGRQQREREGRPSSQADAEHHQDHGGANLATAP